MTDYIAKVKGDRYNYIVIKDLWQGDNHPTYWVIARTKSGVSDHARAFRNVHSAFLYLSRCVDSVST